MAEFNDDDEDDVPGIGHNSDAQYKVTASELRAFIERVERLEAEIKDIQDQRKEVYAEAKGRGYDCGVLRKLIAERKKDPSDVSEFEAIMQLYRDAIGM